MLTIGHCRLPIVFVKPDLCRAALRVNDSTVTCLNDEDTYLLLVGVAQLLERFVCGGSN